MGTYLLRVRERKKREIAAKKLIDS